MDWRNKIDKMVEDEKNQKERERLDTDRQKRASDEAQFNRNLKDLQHKFKCHVCGKLPTRPGSKTVENREVAYDIFEDWELPGDLYECKYCHNWTCREHIHMGICQKCAEKL